MSLIAEALQPSMMGRLFSLAGRSPPQHLSDVLISYPKSGYDLDSDDVNSSLNVDFREPAFVCTALGSDISRFASASFTTFSGLASELQDIRQMPWSLIKMYYAAFYSGHAILRLVGQSCSYLDSAHITHLRGLLFTNGVTPAFSVDAGLYHFSIKPTGTSFSLTRARGVVGGAHEAFWKIFGELLDAFSKSLPGSSLDPRTVSTVILQVESLRSVLSSKNTRIYSWLSAVRNDLQYRHGMSVWQPQTINRNTRDYVARTFPLWRRDPLEIQLDMTNRSDISKFVAACVFIVALCRSLLERIKERSTAGARSFVGIPLNLIGVA